MSELKAYRFVLATENSSLGGVVYNSNYVYAQDDVDKLIAAKEAQILDLIERVQKERAAKVDYKISAGDLGDGLKKAYETIDKLKAENERLKGECCKLTDGCLRLKQCRKEKANIADELRHSNHKRCLAMAKAYHEKSERMYCEASTAKTVNEIIGNEPKDAVVEKFELWGAIASTHCKIWLALAEEPTWAKFLQLIHKEDK